MKIKDLNGCTIEITNLNEAIQITRRYNHPWHRSTPKPMGQTRDEAAWRRNTSVTGFSLTIWKGPLGPYLMPKPELSAPLSRSVPWNAILHQRSWEQVLTPTTKNFQRWNNRDWPWRLWLLWSIWWSYYSFEMFLGRFLSRTRRVQSKILWLWIGTVLRIPLL